MTHYIRWDTSFLQEHSYHFIFQFFYILLYSKCFLNFLWRRKYIKIRIRLQKDLVPKTHATEHTIHKYNTLTTLSFKVDVLLVFHVIKINTSNIFDRAFYSLFYSHFRKKLVWKKRKLVSKFRNYVCTLGDSGLF